ncbi:hypothetical protein M0802_004463 [Mischocyttarus mexicanus]|nr:hypothetical protein M0802_004463 [Mischocyttarus mexicanus]
MTPLTWWVLLATLFGHARIVPARINGIQNACAILCRAEELLELNEEEKIPVVVDKVGIKGDEMVEKEVEEEVEEEKEEENYDEIHVTSQLVEGRRGLRRNRRRRSRNNNSANNNNYHWLDNNNLSLVSNKTRLLIQKFFINLRHRQGCYCNQIYSSSNLISGRNIDPNISNKLYEKFPKQQERQEQHQQEQQRRQIQEEKEEEREKRVLLMTMKIMMKMMMRNRKEFTSNQDYYYYLPIMEKNNEDLVEGAPNNNPSTSDEIDWDLWCMAQCDIGHGGSACECDIIP